MKKLFFLLILIFVSISCSEKIINPDVPNDDTEPPSAVTNLEVVSVNGNSATLYLTAPGDDGMIGRARIYDVRYATSPIDSANFASGTQFIPTDEPNVGGNLDTIVVPGLMSSTKYYFALKVGDENSNWSTISNIDSATTLLEGGWTIYNTSNSDILSNRINDVQLDGFLAYIATDGGMSSLLNSTWTVLYDTSLILIDTIINGTDTTVDTSNYSIPNSIAIENSNSIWVGTSSNGVALLEGGTTQFYSSNDSGLLKSTVDLAISQNKLWVGTSSNGLHSYTLDGSDVWEKYNVPVSPPFQGIGRINCLEATSGNAIWAGLQLSGASVLENSIFANVNIDDGFTNEYVSDITSSGTQVVFGTDEGAFIYDNNIWTNYLAVDSGLPDDVVTAVAVDNSGRYWFGTRFGLALLDGSTWEVFTTQNSFLPDNSIRILRIDISGNLWIGTENGLARLTY